MLVGSEEHPNSPGSRGCTRAHHKGDTHTLTGSRLSDRPTDPPTNRFSFQLAERRSGRPTDSRLTRAHIFNTFSRAPWVPRDILWDPGARGAGKPKPSLHRLRKDSSASPSDESSVSFSHQNHKVAHPKARRNRKNTAADIPKHSRTEFGKLQTSPHRILTFEESSMCSFNCRTALRVRRSQSSKDEHQKSRKLT